MGRTILRALCLIGLGVVLACGGCSCVDRQKADELVGKICRAKDVEEEKEALQEMMEWVLAEECRFSVGAFDPRTGQAVDVYRIENTPPSEIIFLVGVGRHRYRLYLQRVMNITELMYE